MDFYQVMGIARDADTAVLKKAYRKLVKECHPDTHPGDRMAEERFKQIAEAYAVLSDAEKRKQYDQQLAAAGRKQKQNAAQRKPAGRSFDPADFQREFEDLFSFGGQQGGKTTDRKEGGNDKRSGQELNRKNPLDMSVLFEKYMGFK